MAPDKLRLFMGRDTIMVFLLTRGTDTFTSTSPTFEYAPSLPDEYFEPVEDEPPKRQPVAGKKLPQDWKERARRQNQSMKGRSL